MPDIFYWKRGGYEVRKNLKIVKMSLDESNIGSLKELEGRKIELLARKEAFKQSLTENIKDLDEETKKKVLDAVEKKLAGKKAKLPPTKHTKAINAYISFMKSTAKNIEEVEAREKKIKDGISKAKAYFGEGWFVPNPHWFGGEPPRLATINRMRARLNKEIKAGRGEILEKYFPANMPADKKKEVVAYLNAKIFGKEYKKEQPFVLSPVKMLSLNADLAKLNELYKQRKPLDDEAKEERKKIDKTYRKIYDAYRWAKKTNGVIYVNGEPVSAADIQPIKVEGAVIGFNLDRIAKKFGWVNSAEFTLSRKPPELVFVKKGTIIKKKKYKQAVVFKLDKSKNLYYTLSDMKLLFDKAEKETGQRIVYFENEPITEIDLQKEGRKWYLQPWVTIPYLDYIEEEVPLKFSFTYSLYEKEFIEKVERIKREAEFTISEAITSTVIIGNKEAKAVIYLSPKLVKLKSELGKKTKALQQRGGDYTSPEFPVLLITDFSVLKNIPSDAQKRLEALAKKPEVMLTEAERAEISALRNLAFSNMVISAYDGEIVQRKDLEKYNLKDYIALAIGQNPVLIQQLAPDSSPKEIAKISAKSKIAVVIKYLGGAIAGFFTTGSP